LPGIPITELKVPGARPSILRDRDRTPKVRYPHRMSQDFVYLASGSPRRRELLQQIGVPFRVVGTQVDEAVLPGEAPPGYVTRLAAAKADAGWEKSRDASRVPVLAADTAVVLDGKILGKPADRQDAEGMLWRLAGRTHEVLTAVALRTASGLQSRVSRSEVTFRDIAAAEVQAYWETGEPRDKAGAYAIQGRAAIFIADLRGSYSGVMGLPLFETAELLREAGLVPLGTTRDLVPLGTSR
jgi:septum formation protein